MPGGARNDGLDQERVLVVQYGRTVDDVVKRLCTVDGMMRDILLYGQDMRTTKGPGGSAYDGPGGSGGAELPIPEGLAVHVPYSPLDTRTTHKVLKDPTAVDLINVIKEMRPTVVLLHGGLTTDKVGRDTGRIPGGSGPGDRRSAGACPHGLEVLARLPSSIMDEKEEIIKSMKQVGTRLIYLDAKASKGGFAQQVRSVTGAVVVAWLADEAPLVLNAYNFLYVFINALVDIPGIRPESAFALAAEICSAFCTGVGGAADSAPSLPHLLSDVAPALPGLDRDVALSDELLGAIASKFQDVKLCAANAEVRLLVLGIPALLMRSERLGSLCQGIRGVVAAEVSSIVLTNVEPVQIQPPYLSETSIAYRCSVKTESGITFDVVMGGPKDSSFQNHHELLELSLRQVLVADAHSIQLKMPPAGAPLPPYHCTAQVGGGAPTIEVMVSASTWIVYVIKRLTEMPQSKSLVLAGVAAASTSITTAFSKREALRHVATLCNGDFQAFHGINETVTAEMLLGALPEQVPHSDPQVMAVTPAQQQPLGLGAQAEA